MAEQQMPKEVVERVGDAMTLEALEFWWETTIQAFGNRTPAQAWDDDPGSVLEFISIARTGGLT